jgi:hypothetical protein
MRVDGQSHAPAALPPGKICYPLYRRLGGPQGRSGRVRKISPTLGFDPRTVQLVPSRYTVYAIPMCTVSLSLTTQWRRASRFIFWLIRHLAVASDITLQKICVPLNQYWLTCLNPQCEVFQNVHIYSAGQENWTLLHTTKLYCRTHRNQPLNIVLNNNNSNTHLAHANFQFKFLRRYSYQKEVIFKPGLSAELFVHAFPYTCQLHVSPISFSSLNIVLFFHLRTAVF